MREGPCLYAQPDLLPTGAPRPRTLLAFEKAIWRSSGTYRVGDHVSFGGGAGGDGQGYGRWQHFDWEVPPDPACDTDAWWMAAE